MHKVYGILGYPLSHTLSPAYFAKKFEQEKLEGYGYKKFETLDPMFFMAKAMEDETIQGFNVTIPYKEQVIQFLDSIDLIAKEIGAVNTVKRTANGWIGYNTDAYGFEKSIKPLLKPHHTKALILGSGGAAKAIQYVFEELGILYLVVSRIAAYGHVTYNELSKALLKNYTIIINTTPLGMFPKTEECPAIPFEHLTENHLLYDLIYNPVETKFLKKGKQLGAITKNGSEMLTLQAKRSWEIWME